MAGHIQDDTDLTGLWITIDHASETLQYGSEAMLYRFERTHWMFASLIAWILSMREPISRKTCSFADLLNQFCTKISLPVRTGARSMIGPVRIRTVRMGAIVS